MDDKGKRGLGSQRNGRRGVRAPSTECQRRVTIRDVADAAGVSLMTVSNVLNGRVGTSTTETSARVQRAVVRLGYRRQTAARGLRLAVHEAIGMIIIDTAPDFLADPFTTQLVAGLSNEVNSHGHAILLQGMPPERLGDSPMVRNLRTDGLCVLLSGAPQTRRRCLDALVDLRQPIILFQETLGIAAPDVCVVRQDDFAGGLMLGEMVLAKGAQRLAMLVPERCWPAIGERARGVRAAIRRSERGTRAATMRIVRAPEGDMAATEAALKTEIASGGKPDSVLCGNDQMALAAARLLRAAGFAIPEDVMVTGFNGFDFWRHAEPLLTTVQSCAYELGVRGGREALARLAGETFRSRDIVLPVSLLSGASA
jgi:LacI family transcriptional regulator, galactose operon repressor